MWWEEISTRPTSTGSAIETIAYLIHGLRKEAADEIERLRAALGAIANSKYPEDGEWYNAVYIARKALANV